MADMKFLDTLEEVLLERGFPLDIVQKALETAQTVDAVEVVNVIHCGIDENRVIRVARNDIELLPAPDVEPVRHGRWLPQIVLGTRVWDCSECKTIGSPTWKRCPVCEAKMDEEGTHER